MKILISILSKYLQPNFLLIKEFSNQYDKLIFITTPNMNNLKKGYYLEKALGMEENSVPQIEVLEDDIQNIKEKLSAQKFSKDDTYILNITGGTKLMSIALYEFFQDFDSNFFYIPEGKNVVRNLKTNDEVPLSYRLNLKEYFTINSLEFKADNILGRKKPELYRIFNTLRNNRFAFYKVPELDTTQYYGSEKNYFTGGWFEDFCYIRLKEELNLQDDCICKNAKITRNIDQNNDNEIDVMFIKDNQIYIIECKTSVHGLVGPKDTLEDYMYKLAAISNDFGLRVNSYIFTLHNIKKSAYISDKQKEGLYKRMKILKIELLDSSDFASPKPLFDLMETERKRIVAMNTTPPKIENKTVDTPIEDHESDPIFRIQEPLFKLKVVGKIDLSTIKK